MAGQKGGYIMKHWMLNVLIVFFAGVFLVSAGVLGKYLWDSMAQRQKEQQLSQMVDRPQTRPTLPPETKPAESTAPAQPGETTVPTEPTAPEYGEPVYEYEEVVTEDGKTVQLLRDYAELFRLNNDLVGWIQIPDTKINYPVMQTPDSEDYYLHRDVYGDYSRHGTIYVRESCDVFAPSDNVTIYGHRMKDGSMFFGLTEYMDEEYYREHKYIYFDTLLEYHTYEIMSVFITSASLGKGFRYHAFETALSPEDFYDFVDTCKELSLYDTGVTAELGDKFITLSTCDYSVTNGRLVVVAKRIS